MYFTEGHQHRAIVLYIYNTPRHLHIGHRHLVMDNQSSLVTQVKKKEYKEEWGDKHFVPGNGLSLGTLDSQSLGPGSMPRTEVCLFILSLSPENFAYSQVYISESYICSHAPTFFRCSVKGT